MIKVIVGSMRSGKSKAIIRIINEKIAEGKSVKVFYPICASKEDNYIVSRSGLKHKAIPVIDPISIFSHIGNSDLIVIDEISFINNMDSSLDDDFLNLLDYCVSKDIDVVLAGLDLDYRGQSFPLVNKILAYADEVEKPLSLCDNCGNNNGRRTIKKVDDLLADIKLECENVLELEEGDVQYMSVCVKCYNKMYGR